MQAISRKQVFRYAALPGLRGRLRDLFLAGFQYIPLFMALVYQSVRLLPANHPYTNPQNMGRFGIRHVLAEAANNIVLNRRNIDQIILYFTILLGMTIVFFQLGLFAFSLLFQPAMAAMPANFLGFFVTPAPAQDLAYIMLDLVFGVPGLFQSCVATAAVCTDNNLRGITMDGGANFAEMAWPFPVHHALHQLFQVYSLGLLVVAAMIALYFVVAVVVETAQTGQPFGKRFNKVWAPLRIVVAFGLLIPVGYGLNASQYIVLYAAKFGSGFATNGWLLFKDVLNDGGDNIPLSGAAGVNMISQPNPPLVGKFLQFMYEARVCAEFERLNSIRGATDSTGTVDPNKMISLDPATAPVEEKLLAIYAVKGALSTPNALLIDESVSTNYQAYIDFADGSSQITFRFGIRDENLYKTEKGNVKPICGELTMNLVDPRDPASAVNRPEPGPKIMQHFYVYIIEEIWYVALVGDSPRFGYTENYPRNVVINTTTLNDIPPEVKPLDMPSADYRTALQDFYSAAITSALVNPADEALEPYIGATGALEAQAAHIATILNTDNKGWAGAGIWYNRIAELNGSLTTGVLNIPTPSLQPQVMEYVLDEKNQQDRGDGCSAEHHFAGR